MLPTSTHSGTLKKYTNGVIQVTLLLCKMRLNNNNNNNMMLITLLIKWVGFVAIAR